MKVKDFCLRFDWANRLIRDDEEKDEEGKGERAGRKRKKEELLRRKGF